MTTARKARFPVPYVARWSNEDIGHPPVVVNPDGTGIQYSDEVLGDRDTRGILWDRAGLAHGSGKPLYARIHPLRQRRCMARLLCQVCAHPADRNDHGTLWLVTDTITRDHSWPHSALVAEPPVCASCARLALRLCPALSTGRHTLMRVAAHPINGVNGLLFAPGPATRPPDLLDENAALAHGHPLLPWMLAAKLTRELQETTILTSADFCAR
ncbi:hypothetical protein [Actinokineospora sp. NPDC004072]